MTHRLHCSIGPVESFVAQARRTRDFWAGSFLLSWLAGVAIETTHRLGGSVVLPLAPPDLLDAIAGRSTGGGPRHALIPNRFVADVPESFDAGLVAQSLVIAWRALCDLIWDTDLQPHPTLWRNGQRSLWKAQTERLWEIAWVKLAPDDQTGLETRKSWRTFAGDAGSAALDAGASCAVMAGFRELSGATIPGAAQREYWRGVQKKLGNALDFGGDLGGDASDASIEPLSAVAFVKRRFPYVFHRLGEAAINMPGGWTLHGWPVSPHAPSVSLIASSQWLANLIDALASDQTKRDRALELAEILSAGATDAHADSQFPTLAGALDRAREAGVTRGPRFDSKVFQRPFLEKVSRAGSELSSPAPIGHCDAARELLDLLAKLKLPDAPTFYAVVTMDGDRIGEEASCNPASLAAFMRSFSERVAGSGSAVGIVKNHDGFLVYAGGDGVVALLPIATALACAVELRIAFDTLARSRLGQPMTLSGAVHFAPVRRPLARVLQEAHETLNDVAKRRGGRDALAIRIMKPGGETACWSSKWSDALDIQPDGTAKLRLQQIVERLTTTSESAGSVPGMTASILMKIKDRAVESKKFEGSNPQNLLLTDLVINSWLARGGTPQASIRARVEKDVEALLQQCRERRFDDDGKELPRELRPDAAVICRFLLGEGRQ